MNARPLTICDGDCAAVNGCHVGGVRCADCGRWYCPDCEGRDGLCGPCAGSKQEPNENEGEEE